MSIVERARELRKQIETNAAMMDDENAAQYTELFPAWSGDSVPYTVGERVRYEGILYKVLQNHTSQATWTPTDAPSLFAKVLIPDPDVIPDWEQPDSTNAYMKGDKVRFEGKVYESLIDNNVWSPAAYPAGWKEITEAGIRMIQQNR